MSLREQMQKVYDTHGKLTPAIVVDEASDPDHPLHNRFEWDDSIAGGKYRESQAAEMIRQITVVYAEESDGTKKRVRAFHAVSRPDGNTYVPVEEIAQNEFSRQLLLQEAERAWKDLKRKFGDLDEFMARVKAELAA